MKVSRKYPTVKVRPLGWARNLHKGEELPTEEKGSDLEVAVSKEQVEFTSLGQHVRSAEAEPEAEIVEGQTVVVTISLANDEEESGKIPEKVSNQPISDDSFPQPVRAARLKKKRKAKLKAEKVKKPAFPPRAAIPTLIFNTHLADIAALSEDPKTELVRSETLAKDTTITPETPPSPKNDPLTEQPPTEVSVDTLVKPPRISLFRRLFPVISPPKPITASILFLRKVYLFLLLEISLTAVWAGAVTLSSPLQVAMRQNYWLVVFWFFILVDVLWVKCRFPTVARRREGVVLLTGLMVGGM